MISMLREALSSQGLCGAALCNGSKQLHTGYKWRALMGDLGWGGLMLKAQKMSTCAITEQCVMAQAGYHRALQHCSFVLNTATRSVTELFFFQYLLSRRKINKSDGRLMCSAQLWAKLVQYFSKHLLQTQRSPSHVRFVISCIYHSV